MNNSNNVQGNNIVPRRGNNISANYRNLTGTILPRAGAPITAEYKELVESSTNVSNANANNFRMPPSNRVNSRFTNFFAEREAGNTARRVAESALPRPLRRNAPEFVPAAAAAVAMNATPAAAPEANSWETVSRAKKLPLHKRKTGKNYKATRRATRRNTRRANRR